MSRLRTSILVVLLSLPLAAAADPTLFIDERFETLDNWKPLFFPKIKTHTNYETTIEDGQPALKAVSQASASALILKQTFNIREYPVVSWSWKVMNVMAGADATKKAGDDYPIRIYAVFKYDPKKAAWHEKAMFTLAKTIYGEYPPHSSLNYVWANRPYENRVLVSPYTDRVRMMIMQAGEEQLGQWVDNRVNIYRDYVDTFGSEPPGEAGLAVMSDSDNTRSGAVAFIRHIKVERDAPPPETPPVPQEPRK